MCSNGQIHKILLAFSLLLLFSFQSFAEEDEGGWIAMPGQLDDNYGETVADNEKEAGDAAVFVPRLKEKYLGDETDTKQSAFISGDSTKFAGDSTESMFGSTIQAPGLVGTKSFKTVDNDSILSRVDGQWNSSFTFSYIQDTYDYKDRNNIFETVYRDGSQASSYGTFLLKFKDRMFSAFYYGVNLGFGYSRGKGFFIPDGVSLSTPKESNIEFKLYTVPVELALGFKTNLGSYLSFGANVAPGVMGLWQHRDDRDYQDDSKNIRQVGFGYSAEVSLGINISRISTQYGVDLLSHYKISNFSLDFFARNQSYSQFKQADLEITGMSFGVGLTFDYL